MCKRDLKKRPCPLPEVQRRLQEGHPLPGQGRGWRGGPRPGRGCASALWLGALSCPGHTMRGTQALEPTGICCGSSSWFGERWAVLPAALRTAQGGHPEPAVPHRGAQTRLPSGLLGHGCVWVGVVGHFVGEGTIRWQAGFVNLPAHANLSLMPHLLSLGRELATSRLLPGDSSELSQVWARH